MKKYTPLCPFCGSDDVSRTWYGGETGDVFRCNVDMKLFAPNDDFYEDEFPEDYDNSPLLPHEESFPDYDERNDYGDFS